MLRAMHAESQRTELPTVREGGRPECLGERLIAPAVYEVSPLPRFPFLALCGFP